MKQFATTYPQLMNQAIGQRYSTLELTQLAKAHNFAVKLADSIYRAQGVPLLNHLIRSSSIIISENGKIHIVIAMLLHAVYTVSFFNGSCRQRPRQSHRKLIRREFGHDVENLVWKYTQVKWYGIEALDEHVRQLDSYSTEMRNVLLMRLTNEIEGYLDNAMAYTNTERKEKGIKGYGARCVELANHLDSPKLAGYLATISVSCENINLPEQLICNDKAGFELPRRRFWQANLLERSLMKCMRTLKRLKNKR